MSRIEGLLRAYEEFVAQPWPAHLSGAEKTWFAVYEPVQERRLLLRLPEFANATVKAGHAWKHLDLTNSFAEWMGSHKYREAYFEHPGALDLALTDYTAAAATRLRETLISSEATESCVVALTGAGALFGLTRMSDVLAQSSAMIRGRLLVFFPGRHEDSQYRLLDARDGWNYLATPILPKNGD
jgi:hypothetical protein